MVRPSTLSASAPSHPLKVLTYSAGPRSLALDALVDAAELLATSASDLHDLHEQWSASPDCVVLIDGSGAFDTALAACTSLRDHPEGMRPLVCLLVDRRSADDEARAVEAGADLVWHASVSASVVKAVLTRAERRLHPAPPEQSAVSRRMSRARVPSRGEKRFRALFDNALDIVAVIGESGTIHVANAATRTVLGRMPESFSGTSLWDTIHPDDVALGRQILEETLSTSGLTSPATLRARHVDGSWVALELTAQNFTDDPSIDGVLLHARDVNELVWVGAALQESERRFREIFENMIDGVVQIDEVSHTLIQANPAFCRIVGRNQGEMFGLRLLDLVPNEDRVAVAAQIDEHYRGKRQISDSIRFAHRDGSFRYVDIGTSRMELSGGPTTIAVVRDVTRRRDAERTRELFLAIVAHELRTPVAILRNGVELLRTKIATMAVSDRDKLVVVLSEETERLTRLVSDALDVGAVQAGSLALRPDRVALAPIIASVAGRVGSQFEAEATLTLEATDAYVDPLRFVQVLTNLLDNAWRHCGSKTKVNVTLRVDGEFAEVTVDDDGPGFAPELREDIFDRALVPNDRPTCGIGIGLWLSRRLIESMRGKIEADPGGGGRGARIWFTVPISP